MKRLLLVLLAFAGLVWAEFTQKVIPVKNADARQVFNALRSVMGNGPSMHLLDNSIVLNGTQEHVTAAEALIKTLDVAPKPQHNIEVTGFIVLASPQPSESSAMPTEMEPVLRQFRGVLTYKSFRLLDTVILRAREDDASVETGGILPIANVPAGSVASYTLRFLHPRVGEDTVHLGGLVLSVKMPVAQGPGFSYSEVYIKTEVDIKPNQKVAIGKASVNKEGDALILVVSAKVVD